MLHAGDERVTKLACDEGLGGLLGMTSLLVPQNGYDSLLQAMHMSLGTFCQMAECAISKQIQRRNLQLDANEPWQCCGH